MDTNDLKSLPSDDDINYVVVWNCCVCRHELPSLSLDERMKCMDLAFEATSCLRCLRNHCARCRSRWVSVPSQPTNPSGQAKLQPMISSLLNFPATTSNPNCSRAYIPF